MPAGTADQFVKIAGVNGTRPGKPLVLASKKSQTIQKHQA